MSNLPYPVNDATPPYPQDPNAQNPYGQQNFPYPQAGAPSPYGYQQAPMGPSAPYPPQTNLPYGMPPYSQQQQQPGYPDAYPPPGPYQNPPQNSPYPYGNNPPPMGPPDPYPSTDERGMGKGLFSGKGLLGQAMKQADKFGAGKIVGQAAGALGIGGGGQGGHGGQGSHGAQGGPGYGAGQMGNPYGGGSSPVSPQQGYQPSPYPGNYPPPQQPYQQSPVSEAPPSHGGLLSNCRGNKKALLIGINYFGQGGELRGCINDVNNIKSLVQSRGFSDDPSHMVILTDDQRDPRFQPTRENIIEGMLWLVSEAQPNDSLFFHYSGHGSQKMDQDSDEVDGSDETIVPLDYKSAGDIVDDEMNALLVQQLPRGARLTAIFDSCHSATALDLPFIYDCNGQPKQQKYSRKTAGMDLLQSGLSLKGGNMFDKLSGAKKAYSTLSALANEGKAQDITAQTRSTQADAIMFSGCKDYQTSADTNVSGYGATGAASYAFINAVRTGGNLTFAELLAKMRDTLYGKYEQKIQMSTGFPTDMNIPFVF
eukprot:GFUD01109262.1.p1 GENE.GFUD01109262.1~~GFUD01109262.1.p1  ORF type:complete len:537 (-),score=96.11 GFUD01109262.1:758-2368(-)